MVHRICSMNHRPSALDHRTCSVVYITFSMDGRTCFMNHRACCMDRRTCSLDQRTWSMDQQECFMVNRPCRVGCIEHVLWRTCSIEPHALSSMGYSERGAPGTQGGPGGSRLRKDTIFIAKGEPHMQGQGQSEGVESTWKVEFTKTSAMGERMAGERWSLHSQTWAWLGGADPCARLPVLEHPVGGGPLCAATRTKATGAGRGEP